MKEIEKITSQQINKAKLFSDILDMPMEESRRLIDVLKESRDELSDIIDMISSIHNSKCELRTDLNQIAEKYELRITGDTIKTVFIGSK